MNAIWTAIKPPLLEALGSKKVLVMLSGGIVQGITSLIAWLHISGWVVDQAAVDRYLWLVAAYIVGQSVVDHGKPAAIINAAASALKPVAAPVTNNVTVGEINK